MILSGTVSLRSAASLNSEPAEYPAALGISPVVGRLTLAQEAEVRILDPQPKLHWTARKANEELASRDLVVHNPPPGITGDFEGIKQAIAIHRTGFPDLRFEIEAQVAEEDKVV